MAIYEYSNPSERMSPAGRSFFEENPRTVFTNWLFDLGLPALTRERTSGMLFDRLFNDWMRNLSLDPGGGPQWFSDQLYG